MQNGWFLDVCCFRWISIVDAFNNSFAFFLGFIESSRLAISFRTTSSVKRSSFKFQANQRKQPWSVVDAIVYLMFGFLKVFDEFKRI
ncbi:hypothetical protein CEXT_613711 [Caerostris extrusa]|uniref:Uncharacterized protein n=1 Tax=Caerostris extrusa TaxID=172846 RepID=A0AAV4XZH1_CAEEX|nr:hypothetical protein CEXT_613711 [Caerostris extrusa]